MDTCNIYASSLARFDETGEISHAPGQSIQMPYNDPVYHTGFNVPKELLKVSPSFAVGRAY